MSNLPRVSGRELVKALKRVGYEFDRQRGSHIVLRHVNPPHRRVVVPNHKEISVGTLMSILRQVGLDREEFRGLL